MLNSNYIHGVYPTHAPLKSHPPDNYHPTHAKPHPIFVSTPHPAHHPTHHGHFPVHHAEPALLPKLEVNNQLHPPDHEPDLHRPPFEPNFLPPVPTDHPELLKLPVTPQHAGAPDVVHISHEEVRGGLDPRRPQPLRLAPTVHPEHAINPPGLDPLSIQQIGHSHTPLYIYNIFFTIIYFISPFQNNSV